jgi:O-antigen ligase
VPAGFSVADAQVTERAGGAELRTAFAPSTLRGSVYAHLVSDASALEDRYVESRLDAARLAWRAFRSAPLEGIGWSTFPAYSAQRADYGRLAAHDQYLLVAAELGLIGLAFLALLLAAPILGARRSPPDRATAAAIGLLVAAAAGMVFVETLASPHLAIPIAIAAAALTARLGAEPRSGRQY